MKWLANRGVSVAVAGGFCLFAIEQTECPKKSQCSATHQPGGSAGLAWTASSSMAGREVIDMLRLRATSTMRSQRSGEHTTLRSEAPPAAARKRALHSLIAIMNSSINRRARFWTCCRISTTRSPSNTARRVGQGALRVDPCRQRVVGQRPVVAYRRP